jgi:ELMO domain-containing protein
VYCFAMRLLHFRWMRSSRNLMEFNQQLGAMYVELERLLFVSTSLEELCSIL